jgi:hypothetical protein
MLTISIDDKLSKELEKLKRDMPKVLDLVLRIMSEDYMAHVKLRYLSGQVLKKVTGELIGRYKIKKERKNVYSVYPGTLGYVNIFETGGVIRPKKAKVLRFYVQGKPVFAKEVYIRPRPFISRSAKDYVNSGKGMRKANQIIDMELAKRGLN